MRKTKTKLLTLSLVLFCSSITLAQNIGIITKASTAGVGVEIGYRISPKVLLKAGYDSFAFDFNTNLDTEISLDLNSSLKTGSIGLLIDYALVRKVYVSTGLLLNNFETTLSGTVMEDYVFGDVVIAKERLGGIQWSLKPKSQIAPYFGIGFGRLLGSNKLINSSIEFGVIYQGKTAVEINSNGVFSPNSDASFAQNLVLEGSLESLALYPVLKINLALNLIK